MKCVIVSSEKETRELGIKLGKLLSPGDVLCLTGDLGAGKTTFTKALAQALGIEEYVTSPTFTILHEYQGRIPLYHFDVYRIEEVKKMEDIPYEEYFYGMGVCVIEWAELIKEILPEDYIKIEIQLISQNQRKICFEGTNAYYKELLEEMFKG